MKQMIIKVGDDFSETVKGLSINGQLTNSRSYYNKILVLALSPLGILELGDKFVELELDWEVVAIDDEPLNLNEFDNYMNDIIVRDEEGEEIGSDPFSDLSTIQTFSGKSWKL